MARAARERHLYARTADRPIILFDREADPEELTNLVGRDAKLQRELDERTTALMDATGDRWG